ncbi:MAG TPA: prepilin-type N-terminal cleavage/methylation domain-containing protein [Gemmatimonadaceae bacterium]
MHRSRRAGFTLIELLVVVVIIGILAAIAIPKFSATKGRSYTSMIKSDLRNLATAEESYFYDNDAYTTDLTKLNFRSSPGVTIVIPEATPGGWSAAGTNPQASAKSCVVYFGTAAQIAPATAEGTVTCN